MATALSTSWGGRGRTSAAASTAWGTRPRRALAGTLVALAAAVPLGAAVPAYADVSGSRVDAVLAGPQAAATARAVGGTRVTGTPRAATARLTGAQARRLRARGLAVAPDAPVRLTGGTAAADAGERLSVAELTGARESGLTGAGVTVAVVDSGVAEVPALAGRVVQGADFTGEGLADQYGHGTFVAGLLAASGTGVAPGARVVSVKVAGRDGRSSVGRLVLGVDWVLDHADELGISVLNLSVSAEQDLSYDRSPVNALVEAAWFSGITVVASAGNGGGRPLAAPGNDPFVLTVGSVRDGNTVTVRDDVRSPFSNAGRTLDGVAKPEVTSFGQHVRAPLPAGSVLAARQRTPGLPAGYGQLSGTSMATAVASGIAALLHEARPGLSPDRTKGAIVAGARGTADVAVLARALPQRKVANRGLRPSLGLMLAYARLVLGTTDYASVDWAAVRWTAVAWADVTWTDATWTDATWTTATWADATWADATWTSATWVDATWAE